MAELKRNTINQILFTMVDKTDFATLETSLASNFTVKVFGTTNGAAGAATISTVASLVSKVGSGVYRVPLTAARCNFDQLLIRVAHASAATQMLWFDLKSRVLDASGMSDIASQTWAHAKATSTLAYGAVAASAASDAYSLVVKVSSQLSLVKSLASDAHSAAAQGNSRALLMISTLSDIDSALTSRFSDIHSFMSTTGVGLHPSALSDIGSVVWANTKGASVASLVSQLRVRMNYSTVSDLASKITSAVWAANINGASMASNIASQVWGHAVGTQVTSRILVGQSFLSDIDSALSSQYTKTYSAATAGASRALLAQSLISDVDSALTSRFSDLHSLLSTTGVPLTASDISDLRSAITAGPTGGITVSDISDIVSRVWSYNLASQTGAGTAASNLANAQSLVKLNLNMKVSDVYSLVSDVYSALAIGATASDVASAVWAQHHNTHSLASSFGSLLDRIANSGVNITASNLSDLRSAISAGPVGAVTLTASDISDIASRVWSEKYTTHGGAVSSFGSAFRINYSRMSDVYSMLSDFYSDFASKVPKAVALASRLLLAESVISDAYSAAAQTNSRALVFQSFISDVDSALSSQYTKSYSAATAAASRALLNQSRISDTYSMLSDFYSDFVSKVPKAVALASRLLLAESVISDAHSAAAQANSRILICQSDTSDLKSRVTMSRLDDLKGLISSVSDLDSALTSRFSDIHSLLSTTLGASDLYSKVGKLVSRITIAPATQSKLDLVQSMVSDLDSALTSRFSDLHSLLSTTMGASDLYSKVGKLASRVTKAVATNSQLSDLISDLNSDLRSVLMDGGTGVKICASDMSDLRSAVAAGPATANTTSIARAVWARAMASHTTAGTAGSMQSNVESLTIKLNSRVRKDVATTSLLSDVRSDIRSLMSTAGAAVTVSNISDIASAVWGFKWNTNSVASSFGSAFEKVMSLVSDVDSALSSQYTKVYSLVGAGGLDASAISDIASAVWGQKFKGAAAHNVASSFGSAFALAASRISDVDSALSSQYTKVYSAVNRNGSQLSLVKSVVSDAHSAAILAASHASDAYSVALINRSFLSDIDSALTSRFSDINSLLRSVIQSRISDIESALDSQYALGQMLNASGLSDVGSVVDARLDAAFTDATSLNANGLKDRIRTQGWILRNKMKVNDTSGRVDLFKDDNATTAFSVTAGLTDNGVSTLRKRLE